MTISDSDRMNNQVLALRLMLDNLGDHAASDVIWNADEERFLCVLATTWKELERRGHVRNALRGMRLFQLTGAGLAAAIEQAGRPTDPGFQERFGIVMSHLKLLVKDRTEDRVVHCFDVAHATGLPAGWISNMVDAAVAERFFGQRGPSWHSHGVLVVPLDLGIRLLP
jgi:hypothetical protein